MEKKSPSNVPRFINSVPTEYQYFDISRLEQIFLTASDTVEDLPQVRPWTIFGFPGPILKHILRHILRLFP